MTRDGARDTQNWRDYARVSERRDKLSQGASRKWRNHANSLGWDNFPP